MDEFQTAQAVPAAAPEAPAADNLPGTVIDGEQPDATGAAETVEETEQQKAERIVQERKVREERARRKINARFGELTDTIKAKDRAIEEKDRLIAQLAGGQREQRGQPAGDPEPKRQDYDDYETFIRDQSRWAARQEAKAVAKAERDQLIREQQLAYAQAEAAKLQRSFATRLESFAKTNPEFAEVYDSDVDIGTAAPALMRLDNAPAVMLALHKDPALADEIANADQFTQVLKLGELSARLKLKVPQVSKAPAPGTPVGGKPSLPAKDPADMSYEEFVKFRHRQIAQRR